MVRLKTWEKWLFLYAKNRGFYRGYVYCAYRWFADHVLIACLLRLIFLFLFSLILNLLSYESFCYPLLRLLPYSYCAIFDFKNAKFCKVLPNLAFCYSLGWFSPYFLLFKFFSFYKGILYFHFSCANLAKNLTKYMPSPGGARGNEGI